MFSTPLICCSIGVTTVEATTSALAPGYWPETLMIGGAISGYCAIGRRENDTPPRITKTIETTAAKIGRSMKKCESRIFSALGLSRPWLHRGVDDDAIGRRKAVLDHAQAVVELAERDVFLPHHAAVVDHEHEFARLLGADRGIGNEQRGIGRRAGHADAAEHAGRENGVGIAEHRAAADRAGGTVDDVVDEIHLAGVLEIRLVDELERNRDVAIEARHLFIRHGETLVAQIRRLVEGELEAD